MKFSLTVKALREYNSLSNSLQARVDKQLNLLIHNLRHPSLRAKKYDESNNVWQARVTKGYRFYFRIEGDTYRIITITPHSR